MEIGFFFWPFNVDLVRRLGSAADRHGYDFVAVADTPGNAMDAWVAATVLAESARRPRVGICVTNLISRLPSVSACAIASLDLVAGGGRAVLGIGAGHSGTRNIGVAKSATAAELAQGVCDIRRLLRGEPLQTDGGTAHLPWIRQPSKVFLAASHPKALAAAGTHADGVFINYGLGAENVRESEAIVTDGIRAGGRSPDEVEIWQIAALDCNDDGDLAREKIGAMLAFVSGYVIGAKDLHKRGVPEEYREPLLELRRRYSTRPGDADIRLVRELGLFDYLSRRLSICGTPAECREQMLAAKAAGVKRLMFTISLAADPVKTVELFAEHVFPAIR